MSQPEFSIRTTLIALALLGAAIATAIAGHAQTAQPEEPAEAADSSTAAEKPEDEKAKDQPSTEVFIPSEDISEDFAVSFPVDI